MKINFKTLDRRTFCLEVKENDSVADLKTRLEDDFGKQNMFRLIYSGRILRDDDCLAKYDIDPKRFVVVMATKGKAEQTKEAVAENREKIEEEKAKIVNLKKKLGDLKLQLEQEQNKEVSNESLSTVIEENNDTNEDSEDDEEIPDIDVTPYLERKRESENIESTNETAENEDTRQIDEEEERRKIQELKQRLEHLKSMFEENNTEEEAPDEDTISSDTDDENDDDISSRDSSSYFVSHTRVVEDSVGGGSVGYITPREFTIALEVIMSMEYYTAEAAAMETLPTNTQVKDLVEEYFTDNSDLPAVRDIVMERIEEVMAVRPSRRQLEAFLSDLCSIYCQDRSQEEEEERRMIPNRVFEEEEEEEEETGRIKNSFSDNLSQLVGMGFLTEEAEYALRASYNHLSIAVDYLVSGVPASTSSLPPETDNPLAFLRTVPEFQHIRTLVQANPASLQSLLLSFGAQYPTLMESINLHKATFVRMLHEPAVRGMGERGGGPGGCAFGR